MVFGRLLAGPALSASVTAARALCGRCAAGFFEPVVDIEGTDVEENVSLAFSQPFRFTSLTTSGDFNLDGSVDAADYVTWRNGLGTIYNQNDYGVWRAHFGASLGPGSGSALPSAESLSAAVPEPASALLLSSWAAVVAWMRRRIASRVPSTRQRVTHTNNPPLFLTRPECAGNPSVFRRLAV